MNRHPNQKTAVVWTKKDDPASLLAISALKRAGVKVEQRVVDGRKYKTADLQAAVPGATRLPQIVVNDQVVGDMWWDPTDQKLYVFNGLEHILVGPLGNANSLVSSIVSSTIPVAIQNS